MRDVVFVTGASGGIGAAIARAFAEKGCAVALGCNSSPCKAEDLAGKLRAAGGEALVCRGNVAVNADVQRMFGEIEAAFGEVTVLVNNAGHAAQGLLQDTSEAEWDAMLDTHVKGAFLTSRRALPAMLRKKGGCILNISSMWGQVGASCEVPYSTAKAALVGMTKALAKEVGPSGVRVNCIAPGAIETPMLAGFSTAEKAAIAEEAPLGRIGTPQEVAAAAVFLASPAAGFITGQVLGVNGGAVV